MQHGGRAFARGRGRRRFGTAVLAGMVVLTGCTADAAAPDEVPVDEASADGDEAPVGGDPDVAEAEPDPVPTSVTRDVIELDHGGQRYLDVDDGAFEGVVTGLVPTASGGFLGRVGLLPSDGSAPSSVLVRSDDAGDTWNAIDAPVGLPEDLRGLASFVRAPDGALVLLSNDPGSQVGWISDDDGASFTALDGLAGQGAGGPIAVDGSQRGIAVLTSEDLAADGTGRVRLRVLVSDDGRDFRELAAPEELATLPFDGTLPAIGWDGRTALIAVGDEEEAISADSLRIVDADGQRELGRVADVLAPGTVIRAIVFDGGRWLLGGSRDGRAELWTATDLDDGFELAPGGAALWGGEGLQSVEHVHVTDVGVVIVGATRDADGDDPSGHLEVWVEGDEGFARTERPLLMTDAELAPSIHASASAGGTSVVLGARPVPRNDRVAGTDATDQLVPRVQLAWKAEVAQREFDLPAAEVVRVEAEALGGPGEQRVADVIATTEGFVAVGWERLAPDDPRTAAVWRSVDGIDWDRVTDQEAFNAPGGQDRAVWMAATGEDGRLVAVGRDGGDDPKPVSVVSTDAGATWEAFSLDVLGDEDNPQLAGITHGPEGFVIVGFTFDERLEGFVLSSSEGRTWTEQRLAVGADRSPFLSAVAVTDEGLVIVGNDAVMEENDDSVSFEQYPAVWAGPDVTSLQLAELEERGGSRVGSVTSLVVRANGDILAGGSVFDRDDVTTGSLPTLWTGSVENLTAETLSSDGSTMIRTLADLDRLTIAAGTDYRGVGWDAAIWIDDGSGWVAYPHDRDLLSGDRSHEIVASASDGESVVLVGSLGGEPDEHDGVLWLVRPAGAAR